MALVFAIFIAFAFYGLALGDVILVVAAILGFAFLALLNLTDEWNDNHE